MPKIHPSMKEPKVRQAITLIKRADQIFIQVRFGLSERWTRISKEEARALIFESWYHTMNVELDSENNIYMS